MHLEEAFFNGQPVSVKKTVEFVSERVASTCVKHICNNIVPNFKKHAVEEWKAILETLIPSTDEEKESKQYIVSSCIHYFSYLIKWLYKLLSDFCFYQSGTCVTVMKFL